MLLQIRDLRVHYGKAEALKAISMEVEEGEIVTLIGANGAGKTTTLRTISGLKKPTSGEIWFQGNRIDGLPAHKVAQLGIAHIPEGKRLFTPMTVLENLEMGAYLRKSKGEVARQLENIYKHFTVLEERQNQKAGSLSGGEQQMLAIARALMSQPKLLLMDEPSMGLSPTLVDEVARIIRDINQAGVTIIVVEQNARIALSLADRAYVLEVGEVTLHGDAQELANDERVKKAYLGG
jgi:branched-chain amino acid transport system ATP-binding protein